MERTLNAALLRAFISEHGMAELSERSRISVYTLIKMKNKKNPLIPRKASSQLALAKAIGVEVDELFPLVPVKGKRTAS